MSLKSNVKSHSSHREKHDSSQHKGIRAVYKLNS